MSKNVNKRRNLAVELFESRVLMSQTLGGTAMSDAAAVAAAGIYPAGATPDLWRSPIARGGDKASPLGYSSPNGLGLTATQVRGGYGLGSIAAGNISFGGVQGDGTGQTIALIDYYNDPNITTDLATFDAAEGLAAPPSFKVLNQSGQASPLPSNSPTSGSSDWSSEESLDVEWAHAIAPGANLILFECSSSLVAGDATAAAYPGVSVVSNSWGSSESSSQITSSDPSFTTPAGHAGVSFFASTGDTGAQVSYPAESDNVVAVGGTALTLLGTKWSSETTWSSGGGGTSAYEPQPAWQAGTVTSAYREDPDISLDASPSTGVPIVDSWDNSAAAPWSGVWGGTSLSSPMMAALVAIADQGRAAEGLGSLTGVQTQTRLYQLSKANFHDITTGSNGHAAVVGYDEATGIGSPIGNVLVPNLAGAATVTGRIFADNVGTGVYGSGDTALSGRTVYLDLNNDGAPDNAEPTAATNAQGIYTFADQPSGGTVRLSAAAIAGYTLASAATAAITYGATDTANFVYNPAPTHLAITQQPGNVTFGTAVGPVAVAVEGASGTTVATDGSVVTLTLNGGTFANGTATVSATAVNGVATFRNLQVGAGTFSLTASDGTLSGASSASFVVSQAVPQVSWPTPAAITYGTPLGGGQLDATATVAGSFAYTPAAGSTLGAGAGQALSAVFTPADSTDYATTTASTTITVLQATPTLSWTPPAAIAAGTALGADQLDATANVGGTFAYTPAAGTVPTAGAGQALSAVFTPTDSVDYSTANVTTTLTVNPPVSTPISLTGSAFYLERDGANLDVWAAATAAGTPAVVQPFASVSSITLSATAGGDAFTADFSNGTVVPTGGLTVDGYGAAAANALTLVGTGGNDTVDASVAGSITLDGQAIGYAAGSIGTLDYAPAGTGQSLTVAGGDVSLAPGAGTGITTDTFSSINIAAAATLAVPSAATPATRMLVQTGTLTLAGSPAAWTGTLDLSNNDLVVTGGDLAQIDSQLAAGLSTSAVGIVSTAAINDASRLTTLAAIQNSVDRTPTGAPLFGVNGVQGTFDGASPAAAAVLVKYTYFGDATLDGRVDGADYARIDAGFLFGATGWYDGDFNGDGVVDGSDYSLIDNAFNTQPRAAAASAEVAAVPVAAKPAASAGYVPLSTIGSSDGAAVASTAGRATAEDAVDRLHLRAE